MTEYPYLEIIQRTREEILLGHLSDLWSDEFEDDDELFVAIKFIEEKWQWGKGRDYSLLEKLQGPVTKEQIETEIFLLLKIIPRNKRHLTG